MQKYERILVCIDQPQRDENLLTYAQKVVHVSDAKDVFLLNVALPPDNFPILPVVESDGYGLSVEMESERDRKNRLDKIREQLAEIKRHYFEDVGSYNIHSEVISGTPLFEILRIIVEKEIDLVIVGRHYGEVTEKGEKALLATRITRKATCSVLTLPEDCEAKASNVLVPVRNSECSSNALSVACEIAKVANPKLENTKVKPLNLYQVHSGYANIGSSYDEHRKILETNAIKENEDLIEKTETYNVPIESICEPDVNNDPAGAILDVVSKINSDLIVIGARGRTGVAGVLLGSVTEQLIKISPVPVMAVKKKGECLGVVKALLSLTDV